MKKQIPGLQGLRQGGRKLSWLRWQILETVMTGTKHPSVINAIGLCIWADLSTIHVAYAIYLLAIYNFTLPTDFAFSALQIIVICQGFVISV